MVDLILGQHTDVHFKAFQRQWQFIKNYRMDNEFHGAYEMVGPDGNPVNANKDASGRRLITRAEPC
jgi:hypothetical protein